MRGITAWFAALLASAPGLSRGGPPAQIALLEDAVLDARGYPHRPVVRVAFEKQPEGWSNVPEPLPERAWTACFDGRGIGTVRARANYAGEPYMFKDVHDPLPGQKLPFHGTPTLDWAGWMGGPVYRPVVLSSSGSCRDPAGWKPVAPDAAARAAAVTAYRRAVRTIPRCKEEGGVANVPYKDSAISFGKSYRDKTGRWIVTLGVRLKADALASCMDMIEGGGMRTFALGNGAVTPLEGLILIDAGDYDGDGHSELVFALHDYNKDGYVLLAEDLSHRQDYTWSYH